MAMSLVYLDFSSFRLGHRLRLIQKKKTSHIFVQAQMCKLFFFYTRLIAIVYIFIRAICFVNIP